MRSTLFRYFAAFAIACLATATACSSGDDDAGSSDGGGSSNDSGGSGDAALDGTVSTDGGFSDASDGSIGSDGSFDASDGSPFLSALCTPAANLVDTSHPAWVIGNGDAGSCSEIDLRHAVKQGGIITFNCGPNPISIPVTSMLKSLRDEGSISSFLDGGTDVVIDGNNLVTLDGTHTTNVIGMFAADGGVASSLVLQRIAIVNASAGAVNSFGPVTVVDSSFSDNQSTGPGAAILMGTPSSTLTITGSTFTGNQAGGNGGAVLSASTTVAITNSHFSTNTAVNGGGGVELDGAGTFSLCGDTFDHNTVAGSTAEGGGLLAFCESAASCNTVTNMTIDRCTFDSNTGFDLGGGLFIENKNLTMTNSTVSRNSLTKSGASAAGQGGGLEVLFESAGTLHLENDTFANNSVAYAASGSPIQGWGGGIGILGAGFASGAITHCTIASNHGTGIRIDTATNLVLDRSIVANNDSPSVGTSCVFNPFADGGADIVFPAPDGGFKCTSSEINENPLLVTLLNNGGPTETIELDAGTPAESDASCPGADQRGLPRAKCTSGAVEGP